MHDKQYYSYLVQSEPHTVLQYCLKGTALWRDKFTKWMLMRWRSQDYYIQQSLHTSDDLLLMRRTMFIFQRLSFTIKNNCQCPPRKLQKHSVSPGRTHRVWNLLSLQQVAYLHIRIAVACSYCNQFHTWFPTPTARSMKIHVQLSFVPCCESCLSIFNVPMTCVC